MEAMRRVLIGAVLLLAGCTWAPSSKSGRIDGEGRRPPAPVPEVSDRHEFGPAESLQPGQWGRYRVTRGNEEQEITLGVVARDGDRVWLEVVEEGDPRRASLRGVTTSRRIVKAYYREIPLTGPPGIISVQPIKQGGPGAEESIEYDKGSMVQGEDSSTGRALKVYRWTFIQKDEELGREVRQEYVFSPEVPPVYASQGGSGLVRRELPGLRVQLVSFGTGYTALIPPQK